MPDGSSLPIVEAIRNGDVRFIEEHLQSFGPNQPLITADGADMNLLHIAAGIDSNKNAGVLTSLECILNFPEVDVNAFSGSGNEQWSAAHIATSWGWCRSLDLLLKHGADPYITDMNGLNVWDIARDYDNYGCVRVLENRMNRSNEETILVVDDDDNDQSVFSNESATEMTHFDRKFGLAFVEEKVSVAPVPDAISQSSASMDESICALDDSSLRRRLIESGESPGPVVKSTRNFYRRRLQRLISATSASRSRKECPTPEQQVCQLPEFQPVSVPVRLLPNHPAEVNALVDGKFNFAEGRRLEKDLISFFAADGSKSYFNYLLIDPRISVGEGRSSIVPGIDTNFDQTKFRNFVRGIFYAGKGHGKRPLMHLYEAAFQSRSPATTSSSNSKSKKASPKCDRILEIWKEEWGVISLHCFQNISSQEALARECLIIEALGLGNLTNIQIGQNKVKLLRWTEGKRRTAGAFLLFKAYWIFCIEGQRQIRMTDVRF